MGCTNTWNHLMNCNRMTTGRKNPLRDIKHKISIATPKHRLIYLLLHKYLKKDNWKASPMSMEHFDKRYKNTDHRKEKPKSLTTSFSDYIFNALIILIVPDRYIDQQMVGGCYYFAAMIRYFTVCHQHQQVHFTVYFSESFIALLSLPEWFTNKCKTTSDIQWDSVNKTFLLFPSDI